MKIRREKIADLVLGGNLLFWAIAGVVFTPKTHAVRVSILVLNLTVGLLFLFRKEPFKLEALHKQWCWLPAMFIGAVLFKYARPNLDWDLPSTIVFLAGATLTFVSLISLGDNFGIRPALRFISKKGAYSLVRHPIYLGELGMSFGCLMHRPNIFAALLYAAVIGFQVFRIKEEESLLSSSPEYMAYSEKVKWKLLPFIW